MVYIFGLGIILVLIFMVTSYTKKKKLSNLRNEFIDNWGKPKSEKYFRFGLIRKYFDKDESKKNAFHIISEREVVDLDIEDLFTYIDRTGSKVGQQYLYHKLRVIGDREKLLRFDLLSREFDSNSSLRLDCQLQLSKINSNQSFDLESLIDGSHPKRPANIWVAYLLAICALLVLVISLFKPIFILGVLPVLIINWVTHYKNKLNVDLYVNGVVQLRKAMKVAHVLSSFDEIKIHFKEFDFFERINSFSGKIRFIGFEKDLGNEMSGVGWTAMELLKMFFNLEYIVFYNFIDSIEKERDSIDKLFCFIGEVDAAISIASLRAGNLSICKPEFVDSKRFSFEEMVHPLLEKCVSNSLNLADKSMLLTGSNMSGKTSFIRMVAINSLLAQTLNFCFAKSYSAPFIKLYSSIRITDNLLDDTSYYLEEVNTIKLLIEASISKELCLFVLDEIFKGTNTIERVSGGKAILSFLNTNNNFVFVSTHDIELTNLLEEDNYELYHFTEKVADNNLAFDHKLKNGPLTTRNAIKILELHDYPNEIIDEARKVEKEI